MPDTCELSRTPRAKEATSWPRPIPSGPSHFQSGPGERSAACDGGKINPQLPHGDFATTATTAITRNLAAREPSFASRDGRGGICRVGFNSGFRHQLSAVARDCRAMGALSQQGLFSNPTRHEVPMVPMTCMSHIRFATRWTCRCDMGMAHLWGVQHLQTKLKWRLPGSDQRLDDR